MGVSMRLRQDLDRAGRYLEAMASELAQIDDNLAQDDWLSVRARLGVLTADFNEAVSDVDESLGTTGARSRILRYMQLRLGKTVSKEELSGVAGIHEWARRIRELRQDFGWDIHSANTQEGLGTGEYILMQEHPDPGLARAWTAARKARNLRTAGGTPPPRIRIIEFLKMVYPRCADKEQLAHVAGSFEIAEKAIGELNREGWKITECPSSDDAASTGFRLGALGPMG